MARKTNQSSKTRPSSSKANAAGYATRLSRKAEKHSISDVYEYQPGKVKRSKVALQLDRDEASEFRHDSDDQEERTVVQPRLIGETSGDERFDSEEDEEIDSDEAFEESDEERFAGFSFPSKDGDDTSELSASDAEDDPEAANHLADFISNLDAGRKRKSPPADVDANETGPQKRRAIMERTEAGVENEYSVRLSGPKLKLDDLLAPLASQSSHLLSLRKSTKVLASSSSAKALNAPLPQRTQERIDREAAYEQTKEEVDKWSPTMKRIREAEHLSFPLQEQPAGRVSNLELAAKFKPTTELESSVDKLLKSAKMREEDIEKTEELKMNHLSVDEVANRRAELRKMRELLFRAEVKAKRVARIKSKTYRRLKKKERTKLSAKVDEMVDEDDEMVRMKLEVDRARERATLRHKNTGKWAKAMKGRNELDVDERRDISMMLEKGELLRRKIQGHNGSAGDEEEADSGSDEGEENDQSKIRTDALGELSRLDDNDAPTAENGDGRGLFDLKFMKEGMARDREKTNRMVDDFVAELGSGEGSNSETEAVDSSTKADPNGVAIERKGGRVVYRPGKVSSQGLALPVPLPVAEEPNPWLPTEKTAKVPRKKNDVIVEKDSTAMAKSKNKLRKLARKREEEKEKAKDDAVVEISMSNVMTLNGITDPPPATSPTESRKQGDPCEPAQAPADDSDVNSEVEEQERVLSLKGTGKTKGLKAFEQRDLVTLAFAGDNVVQKFEDAKRLEIAEDAPREKDTTLPGWGSWGGTGTRQQPPKPHLIKKIAGIDPKTRADFNKPHVIISEKRDKKAAKYMIKDLPHPYTSKAQFERSMDTPLGTEWNTRVGFQRGTLPKVVKKMGKIIDPLEKLF